MATSGSHTVTGGTAPWTITPVTYPMNHLDCVHVLNTSGSIKNTILRFQIEASF